MPRKPRTGPWMGKRGNRYYVYWYNADKRQTDKLSLDTEEAAEAQARFAEFLIQGRDIMSPGGSTGLTIHAALDYYYDEHIRVTSVSIPTVESAISRLKEHFGRGTMLRDVGIPECRAYRDARARGLLNGRKAGDASIRYELSILRAAANHNRKWKRLPVTDLPTFEMPSVAASKGVWLYPDEVAALLAAAKAYNAGGKRPPRIYAFLSLAYYTAARKSVIERLRWSQVSFEQNRIAYKQPGDRETKKRRPTVPIHPDLLPVLRECYEKRVNDYVLGCDGKISHPLEYFLNKVGMRELPARGDRPAARFSPHVLRHSRATHLLQSGANPYAVANLLGDTLATVLRVYGHHCPDYLGETLHGTQTGPLRASGSQLLEDLVS